MRSIFAILALVLMITSCQPILKLGRTPVAVAPFVLLQDSTLIHAKEVGEEMDFRDGKIIADTLAFEPKKVAMYSNGDQIFINLGRGVFGPRVADGKIYVYSVSNAEHYGYGGVTNLGARPQDPRYVDYNAMLSDPYIQDSGSSDVVKMDYDALKSMIPANTAASRELFAYKRNRTAIRLVSLGGLACFIGGTLIAGNSITKDKSDKVTNAGMGIVFGGLGIMAGAAIGKFPNKMRLRKALAIHNGVMAPERD